MNSVHRIALAIDTTEEYVLLKGLATFYKVICFVTIFDSPKIICIIFSMLPSMAKRMLRPRFGVVERNAAAIIPLQYIPIYKIPMTQFHNGKYDFLE